MSFTQITESDLTNKGVTGLADTPGLSTTDMQMKFDELSTDVIVPKFNNLIDEIEADTAAASIGAVDVDGSTSTVQTELDARYTETEVDTLLSAKVDAEDGKVLSSNDFTDAYKTKLNNIEDEANNYVLPAATSTTLGGVMPDNSTFTVDSNGVGHAIGGGGGTADYEALINHPYINSVELMGSMESEEMGLLRPYLLITSDAGSTVTVTDGTSTITATQVSGSTTQWECNLNAYGTWTITSELSGSDDATSTITVDTVKMYSATVTHISATIVVTYPSDATSCTCTKGTTSYTATSNPETFTVSSIGTWTIEAVVGNATVSTTVSITTDGESQSVTLEVAELTVNYGNDFQGLTITCTDGTTTYTDTAPSDANTMTFYLPNTGSWTVSGTVSGTEYSQTIVVSEYTTYTAVLAVFSATVTVTFPYSAGATCTLSDGISTLTATESPMAFTVGNTGTWTATATLDGVSLTDSATITTDGQSESLTITFGEIDLTYDTEFRGLTVTCTDGVTTITKTAPSGANVMYFYPPNTGTWTISSTYSGTTYSTTATVSDLSVSVSANLSTFTIYGFYIDGSESVPSSKISYEVQYDGENVANYSYSSAYMDYDNSVFEYGDWSQTDFFMPQPVLLSQDCSTKIYLDVDDYTQDVDGNDVSSYLTGASGSYNAMMEWGRDGKKIWYKIVPDTGDTTSATVYIADGQVDSDFHAWSFYDQNDALTDYFYTSIYPASNVSSVLRSLSGETPVNNIAGTTLVGYAKANNQNNAVEWYFQQYCDWVLINLLLVMIGKSTDTQTIFGNGNCGTSAVMTTGTLNSSGLFYGYNNNTNAVKVFGMENYYGDGWKWLAGYSFISGVQKYKLTYGTADGSSASGYIETASAPSNYLTGTSLATNLSSSGIKNLTFRTDGSFDISAGGGSTSTYYADSLWSGSGNIYACVGGGFGYGNVDGAFAIVIARPLSGSFTDDGVSLSCKPLSN